MAKSSLCAFIRKTRTCRRLMTACMQQRRCCIEVASAFCCQSSAGSIPSYRLSSYGRRVFSVTLCCRIDDVELSIPRHLRDPVHTTAVFARLLKTFFFSEY